MRPVEFWGVADRHNLQESGYIHRRRRLGADSLRRIWGLWGAKPVDPNSVVAPNGFCSGILGYDLGRQPVFRIGVLMVRLGPPNSAEATA